MAGSLVILGGKIRAKNIGRKGYGRGPMAALSPSPTIPSGGMIIAWALPSGYKTIGPICSAPMA